MISQAILRLEVGEKIFSRGQELFEENKTKSKSEFDKTNFILINNKLLTTSKIKNYNLKIEIQISTGHILTNSCTCPYYDNTHNKCKHIVAFAHQINNIIKTTLPQLELERDKEKKINIIQKNLSILNNQNPNQTNNENQNIQTVTQLTKKIKSLLEKNPELNNLEVKGEISTFSPNKSGHIYFSIKDDESLINCVMFKWDCESLAFKPKTGDKIILIGNIKLYEPRGTYQIVVKKMKLAGLGDLFAKFLKLKTKLEKEGLFKEENKKKIPKIPKAIGIISSPTGAVIQDIINTVKRRFPKTKLLLMPTPVQGEGSEIKIIEALNQLNKIKEIDTIIIARGGGSLEDLWCFNEEALAKAIHASSKPIISAIGHETDFTICDFVSDIRAPTPTAAAEIATPNIDELETFLKQTQNRIKQITKNNLEHKNLHITYLQNSIITSIENKLQNAKHVLHNQNEKLKLLSSENILKKGFSITTDEKGKAITNINHLKANQKIQTILSNGKLISNITKIDK